MEQSIDAISLTDARPSAVQGMRHKILFLAANPVGTTELALGQEARAIQEELERGDDQNLQLVTRWAVQPMDLLHELRRVKPTIVHFSGNGVGEALRPEQIPQARFIEPATTAKEVLRSGLCFEGDDGHVQLVPAEAIKAAFDAAGSSVKLVVLSACYSEMQAQALVAHVACVVGIPGDIRDDAARYFAIGLYGGLGAHESVATAFKQGMAALHLRGIAQCSSAARLLTAPGIDPREVFIVDTRARRRRCSIVIRATLREFDPDTIARVRDQLRMLTGDVSLEITDVQEGSVKLEISLSSDAAERLRELSGQGELTHIIGFEISSIYEYDADTDSESLATCSGTNPEAKLDVATEDNQDITSVDSAGPLSTHVDPRPQTVREQSLGPQVVSGDDAGLALDDRVRRFLAAGDVKQATTETLGVLGPEILSFLSSVLGPHDRDDVFSAFSERLWQSLKGFQGRCSLRTWAYALARHEATRYLRATRRHAKERVPIAELQDTLEAEPDTYPPLAEERDRTFTWLHGELSEEDRTLLILRVDRNLAWDDIALTLADDPETLTGSDRRRRAARLRRRFLLVKQHLTARARATPAKT